ncbi:pentapeptide repeat-containing protein [Spirillospora sp. NPDC048911]|uniref:pentapeptide repeat-containing protein n=1 Tax=Spirillospora sp. NPDC048911 TaxID=3364527 RepID=UPI00370FAD9B
MTGDQMQPVPSGRRVAVAWRLGLVVVAAGAVLLAAGVVWVLGPGAAWWLEHVDKVPVDGKDGLKGKERAEALDTIRGRAMAVGTGLLAAVAIYYTANNAVSARRSAQAAQDTAEAARRSAEITERGQQRSHELTEQGLVTGRYTTAIEQLGSGSLDIRLGGIYALERIAADSTRDHPTVMDVLTTFVREHLRDTDARSEESTTHPPSTARRVLRPDLHAALTVLGRRNLDHDTRPPDLTRLGLTGLDLHRLPLRKINLMHTDLSESDLYGADLDGANLYCANLSRAHLASADLSRANLNGANVSGAYLGSTDLSNANLTDANLSSANLTDADLTDADLSRADLREVQGQSAAEIRAQARSVEAAVFDPPDGTAQPRGSQA